MTVLVADDDPGTRLLLRRALQGELGCTLFEAADGVTALKTARRERPGLIILDISMPGAGGLDVLRALRGSPETHDLAVVILSADKHEETVRGALGLGVSAYLAKPLSLESIRERLGPLLRPPAAPDRVA